MLISEILRFGIHILYFGQSQASYSLRPPVFVLSWAAHLLSAAPYLTHRHRKKAIVHLNVLLNKCFFFSAWCLLLKANCTQVCFPHPTGCEVCVASMKKGEKGLQEVINTPFTHRTELHLASLEVVSATFLMQIQHDGAGKVVQLCRIHFLYLVSL